MQPFAEAAAELFSEENPDVDVTVGAAGTSGGFEKFCAGETDISDASRPIEPEEEELCEKERHRVHRGPGRQRRDRHRHQPGARDQLPDDGPARRSCGQTTTVTNYSELGEDAETGEPLPDAEVSLYGPGTDSGTFDYFTDAINGEEGVSRKEYQAVRGRQRARPGRRRRRRAGSGYFGFSYYEQNADALNLVSVDDGNGCVAPSAETIQDGEYAPLSRPLFMYPSAEALAEARGRGVHAVRRRQLRRRSPRRR